MSKPSIEERKEVIFDKLEELAESGMHLSTHEIINSEYSWLHSRIYLLIKNKDFKDFNQVREELADRLFEKKKYNLSTNVRKLNDKNNRKSTGLSNEEKKKRKQKLVRQLKSKIKKGEDVSYRHQQYDVDRSFVNQCDYWFKSYKGVFKAAKLDYKEYTRADSPKGKNGNLDEFVNLIIKGENVTSPIFAKSHPKQHGRLNFYFNGYHNALTKAKTQLVSMGLENRAEKIEQNAKIYQEKKELEIKNRQEERQNKIAQIQLIDKEQFYKTENLPESVRLFNGELSGLELINLLKENNWLSTPELSAEIEISETSIHKHYLHFFYEHTIKIKQGKNYHYFYSPETINTYNSLDRKNQNKKKETYNRNKAKQDEIKRRIALIEIIEFNKEYKINFDGSDISTTGKHVGQMMEDSDSWLSVKEVEIMSGLTHSTIRRKLVYKHTKQVIGIQKKNKIKYLININAVLEFAEKEGFNLEVDQISNTKQKYKDKIVTEKENNLIKDLFVIDEEDKVYIDDKVIPKINIFAKFYESRVISAFEAINSKLAENYVKLQVRKQNPKAKNIAINDNQMYQLLYQTEEQPTIRKEKLDKMAQDLSSKF